MKTPESTTTSIHENLRTLEESMMVLLNQLTPSERLAYINNMISRMYNTPRNTVSAAEKIRLVLAHRKGSTLSAEQQEQIRRLSEITNQLYNLENGSNE